jgi:hypothetical protein
MIADQPGHEAEDGIGILSRGGSHDDGVFHLGYLERRA